MKLKKKMIDYDIISSSMLVTSNHEVRALINEHSEEQDAVMHTDGSVIRHGICAWAFGI